MCCTGIKQNHCRYGVDKERTQHNIWRILGFFSVDVVQTALGNRSISSGCSILPVSSTAWAAVGCGSIGVWSSILWIGAFFGVMSSDATLKADDIGTSCIAVVAASGTVVVIGAVGVVWTVGIVGVRCKSRCPWWLRCRPGVG